MVVVLVVLGKKFINFVLADTPYRKCFVRKGFSIPHPAHRIIDAIRLPIDLDGDAHSIAAFDNLHQCFAPTFKAIGMFFKLFDVLFDATLDTKHEFRDFLIEQEGFFHGCISFAPPGRVGKKINLFSIVKMSKEVGEVAKDNPASRVAQNILFDCGFVGPALVARVKKLIGFDIHSFIKICLQLFSGSSKQLHVFCIRFDCGEQFVEGLAGGIQRFTVNNVGHEIQRGV